MTEKFLCEIMNNTVKKQGYEGISYDDTKYIKKLYNEFVKGEPLTFGHIKCIHTEFMGAYLHKKEDGMITDHLDENPY